MLPPAASVVRLLPYRPPFDWSWQLDFLRRHAVHGLEQVADSAFFRVFAVDGQAFRFTVADDPARSVLILAVPAAAAGHLDVLVARVRTMFDLDADPAALSAAFAAHSATAWLSALHPGVRVTRGWDPFETAILTILGQLVSVERGMALGRQLIEAYGAEVHDAPGGPVRLFPAPDALAEASLDAVGTTRARKFAVRALARLYRDRASLFAPGADQAELRARLLELPGIGPWTCEYVMLRATSDADAFPATDLILKRALEADPSIDPERFHPWRGYLAALLWREYAAALSKRPRKAHAV